MFENPEMLVWLALVPLMMFLFYWRTQSRRGALARLGSADLIGKLAGEVDEPRRRLKSGLWLVALAALIIASARPVWGVEIEVISARGLAVVFVLDVSASMDAQDQTPISRLDRAKFTVREIMTTAEGNLFGMVLFAGDAYVHFPLTSDVPSALTFLEAATSRSISRQGTAIEAALTRALEVFDERIAGESVIVLLTDGEDHEGDTLMAARLAAERGVTIHVVGYGTPEGDVIPVFDLSGAFMEYKTDRAGNLVISRLEEPILEEVAEIGAGLYQRAGESGVEAVNILTRLAVLGAAETQAGTRTRGVERFGVFLAVAWLALTLEIFLPEGKREPVV